MSNNYRTNQSGGAQTANNDGPLTWGDVDDAFRHFNSPDDADPDDVVTGAEVRERTDELYSELDADGRETLRENARYGDVGAVDILGLRAKMQNGEIDVSPGGSPFEQREEQQEDKQADRGPIQTEGPVRQNAKLDDGPEKPDPPVAGGFLSRDYETPDSSLRRNSTGEKLDRVSSTGQAMLAKLSADGPMHVSELIGESPNHLSYQDVRRTLDELQQSDLVENQARSNPPKWGPTEEVPDPRTNAFDTWGQ